MPGRVVLGTLAISLAVLGLIWLPGLPVSGGHVGGDYAFFLPNLLAGAFWHLANPITSLPWFSPAQCGGFVLHADPQGLYLSPTQFLTFAVGPLQAVRLSFLLYAAAGFLGATWLARNGFRLSLPASLLAGIIFMFNGFFAVRMMVGHLGLAPFMLTPAMAACVIVPRAREWPAQVLGCAGAATLLALMIQGGMAVLLAPCLLSLLVVLALQPLATGDPVPPSMLRLACGTAGGLALCAGKLTAMLALMANLPRDTYPLPGYASLAGAAWTAARAVFVSPWPDMADRLRNTPIRLFLHEFDYGVGPMALLLMLAWAAVSCRRPARPSTRAASLWALLCLLLAVPIALNTYGPQWSTFLKTLPILRQSSLLLRWFAAYILPATLGAAIALDRLSSRGVSGWLLAAASSAGTVAALVLTVGGSAAPAGGYDPQPVQRSWQRAVQTGLAPPITALTDIPAARRTDYATFLAGQDALTLGRSQLDCYQPLFGYGLEAFHPGTLHPGRILDRTDGRLNLNDPACYLFPAANGCRPGDAFKDSDAGSAASFAAYAPFPWRKPLWAALADWLGIASFFGLEAASAWAIARIRRGP